MTPSSYSILAILDFGSQYTQLIARRLRELGYLSVVVSPDSFEKKNCSVDFMGKSFEPVGIILSGGPNSVYEEGAPTLLENTWRKWEEAKIPVLGICYGMQLLVKRAGGKVVGASHGETAGSEYGPTRLAEPLNVAPKWIQQFWSKNLGQPKFWNVWMSHGDHCEIGGASAFQPIIKSEKGVLAGIAHTKFPWIGLQFHPEVTHSEKGGEFLSLFIDSHIHNGSPGAGGGGNKWSLPAFIEDTIRSIQDDVGEEDHVICALSGGVDSAVAAALVQKAIGSRLHSVMVDTGLLRKGEAQQVREHVTEKMGIDLKVVDASEKYFSALAGVTDPERKRKVIGGLFIDVFAEYATDLSKKIGRMPKFLVQGTLYPDVIESSSGSHGSKHSHKIKSHHNVGGLPEHLPFKLIEPFRYLFKDEVRAVGRHLGVSDLFVKRHPFPGPGLGVRIMGEVTRDKVKLLQEVDAIWIKHLRDSGLYDQVWQAFAVYLPVLSVGVAGDGRTHNPTIALRAVTSTDGMTADWAELPNAFLREVSRDICNSVRGVGRVVYDISSKPPATIEWE